MNKLKRQRLRVPKKLRKRLLLKLSLKWLKKRPLRKKPKLRSKKRPLMNQKLPKARAVSDVQLQLCPRGFLRYNPFAR